jgi:hypothetical protein
MAISTVAIFALHSLRRRVHPMGGVPLADEEVRRVALWAQTQQVKHDDRPSSATLPSLQARRQLEDEEREDLDRD